MNFFVMARLQRYLMFLFLIFDTNVAMARNKQAIANINSDHSFISSTSTNYDEVTINYYD